MTARWAVAFSVLCALWWLAKVLWSNPDNQWDFKVYYFAAEAWRAGHNPYDPALLPPAAGVDVYPFVYPPYLLALFWVFTLAPLGAALKVFLALKFALLGWLATIWARLLKSPPWQPAWVLFLVFAYSSCIFVDFASGNVTTIEQCALWTGVAWLLAGRRWLFVGAVVIASLFKLTPILLLLVLLARPDRDRYRLVGAGFAMLGAVLLLTYAITPELTRQFLHSVTSLDERGRINPALLALVRDAAAVIQRARGISINTGTQTAIYLILALGIAAATGRAVVRIGRSASTDRLELMLYIAMLGYALALPRFKNYSYMLLIVPTYFIATRSTRLWRAAPILVIAALPVYSWLTTTDNLALLANYSQYLIAFAAWCLFLYETSSLDAQPRSMGAA